MCDYLVEGDAALDGGFRWISCGLPVEGLEAQRTLQGETLRTFFFMYLTLGSLHLQVLELAL